MMVRWICRVSLKDKRRSVDVIRLLGVQGGADVVTGEAWQIELVWTLHFGA